MNFKKLLFSLALAVTMIQALNPAEDPIFSFIDQPEELEKYLQKHPETINEKNERNQSILQAALMFGIYPETVRILLDAGANPNEPVIIPEIQNINTFLHLLARYYNNPYRTEELKQFLAKLAALLILYGADDTIKDANGKTPMQISPALMKRDEIIHAKKEREHIKRAQEELAIAALMEEQGKNKKTELTVAIKQLLGE